MLQSLNPEQRRAVEHFEGPCLVLAGAGSGKTRVLTTRVSHLIMEHGVPPDRILAVTFTNKAAQEMRERVVAMLGGEPKGIWMSTFHALGARLMRRHAPVLGWTRAFHDPRRRPVAPRDQEGAEERGHRPPAVLAARRPRPHLRREEPPGRRWRSSGRDTVARTSS